MSNVEDIIVKIKKCLALSKSSNEHEAAAALRHAQKLMEKYNVTDAQISESEIVTIRFNCSSAWIKPLNWDCQLMYVICKAFGGKFLVGTGSTGVLAKFTYIGLKVNATVAEYTYSVLARQCIKSRGAYVSAMNGSRAEKMAAGNSFSEAYVRALRKQIYEFAMPSETLLLIEAVHASRNSGGLHVPPKRGHDVNAAYEGAQAGRHASLLRPVNNTAEPVLRLS